MNTGFSLGMGGMGWNREFSASSAFFQRFQSFITVRDSRGEAAVPSAAKGAGAPDWLSRPDAAAQVTRHEVMTALKPVLGETRPPGSQAVESKTPSDAPSDVSSPASYSAAKRVLDAVAQTLQSAQHQGAGAEELRALLAQAREGVRQGVAGARDVLAGMGVGEGALMSQVDETQASLEAGLAELEAQYAPQPAPVSFEQAVALSASRSQRLELEITTRDGDTVTLTLSSERGFEQNALVKVDEGAVSVSVARNVYASADFSLTVNGELDEDEIEAIQDLMKKVDKLADRFFEQGMQQAFAKAMEMGFDSEELASFSLDMELAVARQASASYQEVAALPVQPVQAADTPAPMPEAPGAGAAGEVSQAAAGDDMTLTRALDTLSGLMREMKGALSSLSDVEHAFTRPGKIFRQLLGGAVALHPDHEKAVERMKAAGGPSPAELADGLAAALEAEMDGDMAQDGASSGGPAAAGSPHVERH